jgi:hypothetical protein
MLELAYLKTLVTRVVNYISQSTALLNLFQREKKGGKKIKALLTKKGTSASPPFLLSAAIE